MTIKPFLNVLFIIDFLIFAESENIPVEKSAGRICSETNIPCPPAIPIAVSGEIIGEEQVAVFRHYGIEKVSVVKEK